ncbi:hypothetical protein MMC13_000765 [Lambiella insularis]|nr:hypothetical protein [Lambiella insularis]
MPPSPLRHLLALGPLLPRPLAAAVCYYPSGAVEPNNHPCDPSAAVSPCCGQGQRCWSNGMCEIPSQNGLVDFVRATCTDATWESPACLRVCLDSALCGPPFSPSPHSPASHESHSANTPPPRWESLRPCHGPLSSAFCCDPSGGGYACCADASQLVAATPLFPPDSVGLGAGQVLPSSLAAGLVASASVSAGNAGPTAAPTVMLQGGGSVTTGEAAASTTAVSAGGGSEGEHNTSTTTVIGASVGGAVALLIMVGVLVLLWRRQRRRRERQRQAATDCKQKPLIGPPQDRRGSVLGWLGELERTERAVEAGKGRVRVAEMGREGEAGRGSVRVEMEVGEKGRAQEKVVELEGGGGWL